MESAKNILIQGATLLQPKHALHGQPVDAIIENGRWKSIEKPRKDPHIPKSQHTINAQGQFLSVGFVDMLADFADPGFEHKEDLISGSSAAAAAGFTHMGLSPFTDPVRDNKTGIQYVLKNSDLLPVNLLPLGTLSVSGANEQLPEMFDMASAGAVGFYSGKKQVHEKLLVNALRYSQNVARPLFLFPQLDNLSQGGQVNESVNSSKTGLNTIPHIAETLALKNIVALMEYCGGRVHITHISTAEGLRIVEAAKKSGLEITCGTPAHQLAFTDAATLDFDTRNKVLPPYRNESDRQALIEACQNGVIDVLFSDHEPVAVENKKIEFDLADFGISNLQTAIPVAYEVLKDLMELSAFLALFTENPARILGLSNHEIKEGNTANASLFSIDSRYEYTKELHLSKSENSPFFGNQFHWKVQHQICQGTLSKPYQVMVNPS